MKKLVVPCAALLLAVVGVTATAGDKGVESGLKPGDFPQAFLVTDVTGPEKDGDPLCYRCRYGARPVVAVFARDMDDNVRKLAKKLDEQVARNSQQKMASFVVLLSDEPDKQKPKLAHAAAQQKLANVPLTVYENSEGPRAYKLSDDAAVTVLMWVENSVKVNHAYSQGQLTEQEIEKIVSDTKKILE